MAKIWDTRIAMGRTFIFFPPRPKFDPNGGNGRPFWIHQAPKWVDTANYSAWHRDAHHSLCYPGR